MADQTKQEEGNPDMTEAHGGVASSGRQLPPDARPLSPGHPDSPDRRAPTSPGGPVVEKHPSPEPGTRR